MSWELQISACHMKHLSTFLYNFQLSLPVDLQVTEHCDKTSLMPEMPDLGWPSVGADD